MERALTWSYGGGTQSIALAILIRQGKLPKPEYIGIADTSRERTSTWDYLEKYVSPMLAEIGLSVDIIPHSYSNRDLYSTSGRLLIPAFTEHGMMPTFCSNEWKKLVVRRRLRELGYGRRKPVITWIGMSKDEFKRMKPSGVQWQEYYWPLIYDYPVTREECKQIVRDYGFPDPPKSSCWMCPHMSDGEWLHIRGHWPDDFQKAIKLEKEIREKDDLYLFDSQIKLEQLLDVPSEQWSEYVYVNRRKVKKGLYIKEDMCDSGYCFV
jgi:hypothetical protein